MAKPEDGAAEEAVIHQLDPRQLQHLPAGIFDASFASLATFAAGLAAVASFEDADLGVYALFFAAFLLGSLFPANLVFVPAQVAAVELPTNSRLGLVGPSVRLGAVPSVVGGMAALVAMVASWSYSSPGIVVPLTISTGVTVVLSPIQDHLRRMFHVGDKSWRAAAVSLMQVAVTVGALLVLVFLDVPAGWRPFGALALANTASLALGFALVPRPAGETSDRLNFRELVRSGKWLLVESWLPAGAGFGVAAIVAGLAGADALGHAEAARVVAQPVLVLATGLSAVLAPRAVEAAMERDRVAARRMNLAYMGVVAVAAIAYLAIAAGDWAWNPMGYLVPAAYAVSGLVVVTVIANVVSAALYLPVNELLGARRSRFLAAVSALVIPVPLAIAASAGTTGAFARPLGDVGDGLVSVAAYRAALRRHYPPVS